MYHPVGQEREEQDFTTALLIESLIFVHSAKSFCGLTMCWALGQLLGAWVSQIIGLYSDGDCVGAREIQDK